MRRARPATLLPAAGAVLAAEALLAAAFAAAGRPAGAVAAAAAALAWLALVALAWPGGGVMLFGSLGLGVAAGLWGAPAWLCAAAAAASVAAWDLAGVAVSVEREADPAQEARVVRGHLGALCAGLLPGVALAALLGHVRIALPLAAVVTLALVAVIALDRAWRRL